MQGSVRRDYIMGGSPVKSSPPDDSLFIKDLIRRVHAELLESRAERERSGEPPIFTVQSLTLEVNFVAEKSKDVKGGLDFKVITVGGANLGGALTYHHQQVHKVTLNLLATSPGEEDFFSDFDEAPGAFHPRPRRSSQ
jgi:hypothetical protein